MDTDQVIEVAVEFLNAKRIKFSQPAIVVPRNEIFFEVIFPVPEALDCEVVADPPDTRVLVNSLTGSAELVEQM